MKISRQDGFRIAERVNQYNLQELFVFFAEHASPEDISGYLKTAYFSLIDYILKDSDFHGGNPDFETSMYFTKELWQILERVEKPIPLSESGEECRVVVATLIGKNKPDDEQ